MVNKTDVNRNTRRQPHWNGKNPAQIPDAAPRSRTALDPVAYDNLIKQHGVRVKVYRSMFCPNVKSVDGGEHNIDCTLCNGSGYLDVDPIESVAYLSNQNFQEEMTVEGYHDGNSVGGTFLGGIELQYFTRVDLMDFTQPFYERVLRLSGYTPQSSTIGTSASLTVDFDDITVNSAIRYSDVLGTDSFFQLIDTSTTNPIGAVQLAINVPDGNREIVTRIDGTGINFVVIKIPDGDIADLATLFNTISTDPANPTELFDESGVDQNQSIIRTCTAVASAGNVITLTRSDIGPITTTPVSNPMGSISDDFFTNGVDPTFTAATNAIDNLKYDCARVNVIIDKTGKQYFQDHQFRLNPQGNIVWTGAVGDVPGDTDIYTVHYESVIQYRAISAMHINRFAQVPDRSTGKVAQVKMPEQWMLQKEFLIIRRDKYGNEIGNTGIYGDIIAAQPINPAPPDTL